MKKLLLSAVVSTVLLSACSENNDSASMDSATQQGNSETVAALQKSGTGIQGAWSFCHDKKLAKEDVVESCNLYDSYLWQFDDGEITVGKVAKPLVTENCTTQCYDAALAELQVKNLASGSYTKEDYAVIIDITDSNDEVNFPKCQVRWNIIDQIDDQHQQWQLENVNCTTPIFDFTTWVKKIN
ncbi:hypothetical protein Q4530_12510 [Colwellia sp. 1_MG-2023]|uniref:hypothetical protein n=1 Tax=unclassified Colwellia TaxID=196834 RepID=UPI001C087A9E|nr:MULTISPECIES: hypothetical protein [unclassified Colwellia]MBU2925426.1 hypothetical protein [Colwellia sp. C2M11]MDO6489603.1 hypothetical protein [Colwellia sp. 6_MG-2023]MDO6653444.1 hypothetical protein [Colwellia sp. 3_MG-2023]MDO6666298.1 hypothetical protein [Colwellia sp. 2_MG-2023]MDO6690601.1 hypothetical protein [Colwellia sp. 1_MG-2023]